MPELHTAVQRCRQMLADTFRMQYCTSVGCTTAPL